MDEAAPSIAGAESAVVVDLVAEVGSMEEGCPEQAEDLEVDFAAATCLEVVAVVVVVVVVVHQVPRRVVDTVAVEQGRPRVLGLVEVLVAEELPMVLGPVAVAVAVVAVEVVVLAAMMAAVLDFVDSDPIAVEGFVA
jgi:hypothetical protein